MMLDDNTINYIIIEDEYFTALGTQLLIKKLRPDYQLLGIAEDSIGARKLLANDSVGLVICDIELSDKFVFDVIDDMGGRPCPAIIFTTGYVQYRDRASDYHPVAFLLKPVVEEELNSALTVFEHQHYNKQIKY